MHAWREREKLVLKYIVATHLAQVVEGQDVVSSHHDLTVVLVNSSLGVTDSRHVL